MTKYWKRNLATAAVGAAAFVIVLFSVIARSDVSKLAFATAQSNQLMQQRFGVPIKRGFFMSGSIEISGPSGHANIAIPISGPLGRGTLYAVARKSAGVWKFDILEVAFNGESKRVNLLATSPAESNRSPVP